MVYNPLPWPRSGVVEIDGTSFVAKDIPALGYRTFPPPPPMQSKTLSGNTLENEFIKVTLDPVRGVIASLLEKSTGREWVDGSAEYGLGQYLNERFRVRKRGVLSSVSTRQMGYSSSSRDVQAWSSCWGALPSCFGHERHNASP